MSNFIATVSKMQSCQSLHIVNFDFYGIRLSMMSLDLNSSIQVGTQVRLTTKPSHIAIAKEFSGEVSYSNQIKTTIIDIENGELLSSIKLQINDTILESIITYNSSKRMNLKVGDEVTAFIKASELAILEVIDD